MSLVSFNRKVNALLLAETFDLWNDIELWSVIKARKMNVYISNRVANYSDELHISKALEFLLKKAVLAEQNNWAARRVERKSCYFRIECLSFHFIGESASSTISTREHTGVMRRDATRLAFILSSAFHCTVAPSRPVPSPFFWSALTSQRFQSSPLLLPSSL